MKEVFEDVFDYQSMAVKESGRASKKILAFLVVDTPLLYTREVGVYIKHPTAWKERHTNLTEQAIHFR